MKANELMIGDWVICHGEPMQIMEIFSDLVNAECWPYEYDDLQPIPLTPEILERNGFVPATNGVSWYLRDDDTDECLLMLNKIHNAFVMSTAGMTIGFQYVHQLQHLLRLCGIKKEIIL